MKIQFTTPNIFESYENPKESLAWIPPQLRQFHQPKIIQKIWNFLFILPHPIDRKKIQFTSPNIFEMFREFQRIPGVYSTTNLPISSTKNSPKNLKFLIDSTTSNKSWKFDLRRKIFTVFFVCYFCQNVTNKRLERSTRIPFQLTNNALIERHKSRQRRATRFGPL